MAWVANFLDRIMAIQEDVLRDVPDERKKAGYGRAAELIIQGPGGGIFELWFSEQGVRPKPDGVQIKNQVYMTEDTFLDMLSPDIDLEDLLDVIEKEGGLENAVVHLFPRLDFRTAVANGLVTIGGDTSDVDSEEWARIIENVLLKIAFPIVIRGLVKKAGKPK